MLDPREPMMRGYSTLHRRVWNMRPWRSSPLMRASYRVQALLRLITAAAMIGTVPLAIFAGMVTFHDVVAQNAKATAGVHTVMATIDNVPDPKAYPPSGIAVVPVHWTDNGKRHTDQMGVGPDARKGQQEPILVQADGNPAPPQEQVEPTPNAVIVGLITFALANVVLLALWRLFTLWLDRRRRRQWEREWSALGDTPDWNHL